MHSQQAFGKNNLLKLYTVLPILTQIAIIVKKSDYLSFVEEKPVNLVKSLPCGETTLAMLGNLWQVNFSALKLLPFDHDIYNIPTEEKLILANEKILQNACLLHYGIDLSAVQRYCGGRWTGEHRYTGH